MEAAALSRLAKNAERAAKMITTDLGRLEKAPGRFLNQLAAMSMMRARAAVAFAADAQVLTDALRLYVRAQEGLVRLATPGTHTLELAQRRFTLESSGRASWSYPARWEGAFWYGLAVRDQEALERLMGTPGELMYSEQSWHAAMVQAAVAAYRQSSDAAENLARARAAVAQERDNPFAVEMAPAVVAVLEALHAGDDGALRLALTAAADAHETWWHAPARAADPAGLLGRAVLGLCCLAHDRGFRDHPERPFLPTTVIRGAD